ncbi:MAG TPA: alanine racemase [Spirochaetia bacterium]|nr:alanine racemase [Spirochaetia bacterium]
MRPTRALIHRSHLEANLEAIRRRLPPGTEVCAAVKANAYGHGVDLVAPWLAESGVGAFGVATVEEGVQIRRLGLSQPIFLLGTLQPDEVLAAVEADLDLFVWTVEAVQTLASAARGRSQPLRVHLKVDTGMGRVGCRPEDAETVAGAVIHALPLELTGICTHFASSDGPGPTTVPTQLDRFSAALGAIRGRGWTPRFVHAANSGGVLSWPGSHFNLVRPGIVLYGYPAPTEAGGGDFRPVMELVSRVGYVKTVPAGTTISYGSRYTTERVTDVVTIPVGYADGYRRSFTNRAPVWIAGREFRVSGTVCMDQFMVDVGPDSGIQAGDPVVLFGPPTGEGAPSPPTAETLAHLADTISYELLCGISARVPRIPV